jgi:hypothetical protein
LRRTTPTSSAGSSTRRWRSSRSSAIRSQGTSTRCARPASAS